MYNIVIFRADGSIERSQQPKMPTLEQLQAAVGGYIETVPYFTKFEGMKRGRAYCNEDGIAKGLLYNMSASSEWRNQYEHATNLVGNVIFYTKAQPQPNAEASTRR